MLSQAHSVQYLQHSAYARTKLFTISIIPLVFQVFMQVATLPTTDVTN
jgi:hypothetical protein